MANVLQFALLGLGLGALFTLLGQAVVVTYKGSGVLNFGAGAVGMVGAYVCFDLRDQHGVPLGLAVLVGIGVAAAIGAAMHLLVMRRIQEQSATTKIVATLGLLASLDALAEKIWAPSGGTQPIRSILSTHTVTLFGHAKIGVDRLCIVAVAVIVTLGLLVVQKKTRVGLATQAVAESNVVAALMGWSPAAIGAAAWAAGSAIAAVAAILAADLSGLSVSIPSLMVLEALAAAVIGGFESLGLTFAGGMAIGVGESLVSYYIRTPGWAEAVPLLVILGILVLRGTSLPGKSDARIRLPKVSPGKIGPASVVIVAGISVWVGTTSLVWLGAISVSLIFALVGLSLVVVTGFAGQISLAQFALAGIGGYFTVLLNVETRLPLFASIAVASIVTVVVGMLVAVPALRTRGSSLAIATLALATVVTQLVLPLATRAPRLASTNLGQLSLFGVSFSPVSHPRNFAYLLLGAFCLAAILTANLRRSSVGTRMLAVRANERAAASLGISVRGAKILAFAIGGLFAGVAGGLIEAQFLVGDFSQFTVTSSVNAVLNTLIGGIGWPSGAALGGGSADAGVVSHLISKWFNPSDWLDLGLGVSVLFVVVLQPDGVAPFNIAGFKRLSARVRSMLPARVSVRKVTRRVVSGPPAKAQPHAVGMVVEARDVSVKFGTQMALDRVSITLRSGEILGLIGSNGAGKSTFIEAITGYQRLEHGLVTADGRDLRRLGPTKRAKLGIVRSFQSVELFEDLTVWENIAVAAPTATLWRRMFNVLFPGRFVDHANVWAAIDQFRLESVLAKYPVDLDHATRRRVAVTRAIAAGPRLLLLDEPAAGLHGSERTELREEIRRVVHSAGVGVVIVEHDVEFVFGLCDRVIALEGGRVIAEGLPSDVRRDPAVVTAYLGEAVPTSDNSNRPEAASP